MFRKGHRLFSVAAIGLLLAAAMHAIAFFAPPPDEIAYSLLAAAMQAYRFDQPMGRPSMADVADALSASFAVLLAWMGAGNLVISRYADFRGKLMRRMCTLNLLFLAGLAGLLAWYDVGMPALVLGITWVLFFVARYRLRRSRQVPQPPPK